MNRRNFITTSLAIPCVLFSNSSLAQQVSITGAGATFPAPLYQRWAQDFRQVSGIQVNYQSIGSGAGINQIRARTVDFGATDAPLTDPGDMFQFPMVEGEVVAAFNLPGIRNINLTLEIVSRIYQGEITRWNHADIVALNPGVRLPNMVISPIYRADGSGTTFVWTSAMKSSGFWQDVGVSVAWKVGQGARGNEGVSNMVSRSPGAIGYIEIAFAKINNISMAKLEREVRARTFILVHKNNVSKPIRGALNNYFEWCYTKGGEAARRLYYTPLPDVEYQHILQELKKL